MTIFENLEKLHGQGVKYASPSKQQLKRFRTLLPKDLVDAWEKKGWRSYSEGLIWTVDPDLYADVVAEWLPTRRDSLVLARFSFGDLLAYSKHTGVVTVDVRYGRIFEVGSEPRRYFRSALSRPEYLRDRLSWELHKKAVKKLGVLAPDEVYAFVPALPMGGGPSIKYVQKEKLFPHLTFLVQLFG